MNILPLKNLFWKCDKFGKLQIELGFISAPVIYLWNGILWSLSLSVGAAARSGLGLIAAIIHGARRAASCLYAQWK